MHNILWASIFQPTLLCMNVGLTELTLKLGHGVVELTQQEAVLKMHKMGFMQRINLG